MTSDTGAAGTFTILPDEELVPSTTRKKAGKSGADEEAKSTEARTEPVEETAVAGGRGAQSWSNGVGGDRTRYSPATRRDSSVENDLGLRQVMLEGGPRKGFKCCGHLAGAPPPLRWPASTSPAPDPRHQHADMTMARDRTIKNDTAKAHSCYA